MKRTTGGRNDGRRRGLDGIATRLDVSDRRKRIEGRRRPASVVWLERVLARTEALVLRRARHPRDPDRGRAHGSTSLPSGCDVPMEMRIALGGYQPDQQPEPARPVVCFEILAAATISSLLVPW